MRYWQDRSEAGAEASRVEREGVVSRGAWCGAGLRYIYADIKISKFRPMAEVSVVITPLIALIFGTIGLGGGIYETLLVDRVWPDNLAIIQPQRGGLDRKLFWVPIHTLYEVALLASVWQLWSNSYARSWIFVALVAHFVSRAWSFAYFIPKALRFEKLNELTDSEVHLARQWVRLSRCRPVLEAASIISLGAAILHLGG
jgi:hypothetical protein